MGKTDRWDGFQGLFTSLGDGVLMMDGVGDRERAGKAYRCDREIPEG